MKKQGVRGMGAAVLQPHTAGRPENLPPCSLHRPSGDIHWPRGFASTASGDVVHYFPEDVDLDESLGKIEAIGYKDGSTLFIHGEEYAL